MTPEERAVLDAAMAWWRDRTDRKECAVAMLHNIVDACEALARSHARAPTTLADTLRTRRRGI